MDMVISCWRELETCRDFGMGIGPIPWTAIVAWAEVVGLDRDATWKLTQVIRKLDNDYLGALAAKRRQQENSDG
jgi:hypothetical protein